MLIGSCANHPPPSYSFSNDSTYEKGCLYKNKNNKTIHNDTELASEL